MPRLIQVIEVEEHRGMGKPENPDRFVTAYYTPEGGFLAERDLWAERQRDRCNGVQPVQQVR